MGFEPMCLVGKRFSRPPRYDRFDTSPYSRDFAILTYSKVNVNLNINNFSIDKLKIKCII